jgi:hypothetical protein
LHVGFHFLDEFVEVLATSVDSQRIHLRASARASSAWDMVTKLTNQLVKHVADWLGNDSPGWCCRVYAPA